MAQYFYLGIGFSLFNALSPPPLIAALADLPEEVRGAIMNLNSFVASIGWITTSVVGGRLYLGVGFKGFGPDTIHLRNGSSGRAFRWQTRAT